MNKPELEQAEFLKLKLLMNSNPEQFEIFTGEEQVKYIDGLDYEEGSEFLNEKFNLLKEDMPAPKNKYRMDEGVIRLFVERKYPFNPESEFVEDVDISDIDFSNTNIKFKQWFCAKKIYMSTLPINKISGEIEFVYIEDYDDPDDYEESFDFFDFFDWIRESDDIELSDIDFTGCSFKYKYISGIDFSKSNITGKQFCQAGEVLNCTLPKGIDFRGCSFGWDISGIDFSESNITGEQLCQASNISGCTLPKGIDFRGCSFEYKDMDISGVDFSDTNIELSQWFCAKEIYMSTLPINKISGEIEFVCIGSFDTVDWIRESDDIELSDIDFTGCSFEYKDISGKDFSKSNITGEQFCQAEEVSNCKLPKGIDFRGSCFEDMDISGIDFSESNITGEQFCQARGVLNCTLPKGIDFRGCSFWCMDISGVDFSESNITGEQFCQVRDVSNCKLPKGIDFRGCFFEDMDISGIDFSKTNISAEQLAKAKNITGCKLPKGIKL